MPQTTPRSISSFPDPSDFEAPSPWLRALFSSRRASNGLYSLRAFARDLGLSPGVVSELLADKRPFTSKTVARIAGFAGLGPAQARRLAEIAPNPVAGRRRRSRIETLTRRPDSAGVYTQLSDDTFRVICQWQHFAILNLVRTDDCRHSEEWIAARLGIPVFEARASIDRLIRVGLLERKGRRWARTKGNLSTATDIPSAALRQSHRETLLQAIDALESVPIERRDITSITFATSPRFVPEAKRLIREFRLKLSELAEAGPKTEVYNLNIQLVPVTRALER